MIPMSGSGPVLPGPLDEILLPRRMQLLWLICPGYPMLHVGSPEEGIVQALTASECAQLLRCENQASARHPGRRGTDSNRWEERPISALPRRAGRGPH